MTTPLKHKPTAALLEALRSAGFINEEWEP